MDDKLVSVIMSVYNSKDSISNSVESILNQTYEKIEFLIMDDNSNDGTFDILKEYEKKDKRIKLSRNRKNIGLTKSLNILLNKAEGGLIARQDADDVSLLSRFDEQINFITMKRLDGTTSRSLSKQTGKKVPKFSLYLPTKLIIKYKNPFIHGTLLIKSEVINELGGYDENFYYSQDYKLLKDALFRGYKIKIQKKVLYHLNQENNISSNNRLEQKYYADCVKNNLIPNNR